MYLLAIETTGPQLSVAVINSKCEIVEFTGEPGYNHLTNLAPMIDEITRANDLDLSAVSAIAVSAGPGSFTGIRIGVSTARALAQSLNVKAIQVPTLMTFAYHVPDYRGVICPIFDARRSQVYGGAFLWNEEAPEDAPASERIFEIVRSNAYALEDYLKMLNQAMQMSGKKEFMLFGDGVAVYGERVAEWANEKGYNFYDARMLVGNPDVNAALRPSSNIQAASSVARLGLDMYKEGYLLEYGQLEPIYMRQAEAERKLAEKKGAN